MVVGFINQRSSPRFINTTTVITYRDVSQRELAINKNKPQIIVENNGTMKNEHFFVRFLDDLSIRAFHSLCSWFVCPHCFTTFVTRSFWLQTATFFLAKLGMFKKTTSLTSTPMLGPTPEMLLPVTNLLLRLSTPFPNRRERF